MARGPTPLWTQDEVDQLCAWRAEGISRKEIARRLGRSFSSVRTKIDRLAAEGMPVPSRFRAKTVIPPQRHWTPDEDRQLRDAIESSDKIRWDEIAAKFACTARQARTRYLKLLALIVWTPEMDRQLRALRAERNGLGWQEIALRLGVPRRAAERRQLYLLACDRTARIEQMEREIRADPSVPPAVIPLPDNRIMIDLDKGRRITCSRFVEPPRVRRHVRQFDPYAAEFARYMREAGL
ncbi:MAG TPA: SANT/Myb-like DNA-binding domain-containing protein [Novosphingobium sp.]|nr:SANT/Myb-like DNA-binding domain-containing protein [Novosphingobium sp.]